MFIGKKAILSFWYFSLLKPVFCSNQTLTKLSTKNIEPKIMDQKDKFSVAYVTVPSVDVGKTIGNGLVTQKLAACVNIIPQVISIYEWKNEMQEDNEALLMIKTRTSKIEKLTEYVKKNHPYEVCEVISLPIQKGNEQYLKWLGDVVPED